MAASHVPGSLLALQLGLGGQVLALLDVAHLPVHPYRPPLSVEASGTSSTVSLRASRPDNSTLGSPAEVYLEAKDFVPRFRGFGE